ncbi:hypothetical protein D7V86_24875 [bacterium D16-51]|nr:hypothetical protein D7V96_24625 [bacterium D16-59]RKI53589.1 hypothetical protein D7V86_24875 [bacterium D16-51]
MKDYTAENPEYKGDIKLLETTDTDHAENFNITYRQLMDNTAANHEAIEVLREKSVQGAGLVFHVDADGILNVTYDDGEEETESETDNPGS